MTQTATKIAVNIACNLARACEKWAGKARVEGDEETAELFDVGVIVATQIASSISILRPSETSDEASARDELRLELDRAKSENEQIRSENEKLRADLKAHAVEGESCEGCGAPLFPNDDYVTSYEDGVAGCWAAMTDRPDRKGRPCFAYRVGKPDAHGKVARPLPKLRTVGVDP